MADKIITPGLAGEINKMQILDCVRRHGPISRADIRRAIGMSFPSVSASVKQLLDTGYLVELGAGDNLIGRKSTLVAFNERRGFVIGVDIGRSQIRAMVSDLGGNNLALLTGKDKTPVRSDLIAGELRKLVDLAVEKAGISCKQVLCVSIGIPGIIDKSAAPFMIAHFLESLREQDLIDALRPDYDVPVMIENSVQYGAIGEKWKGAAKNCKNMFYLNYGVGLGAAVIINGELYRGCNGAAGEVGFMILEQTRIRRSYSEQGSLESIISGFRISEILHQNGVNCESGLITADADSFSDQVFGQAADLIGMMLINASSVLNPELVVVSGGFGRFLGERYLPRWIDMLRNHFPFPPRIVCSALLDQANVYGAVAAALRLINGEISGKSG